MKDTTQTMYHERILDVLLHIQANLDDELNLESLAALSCFSPVHFHRIFKGMMGETVIEHIRRIRLERSALRLVCSRSNVTEAAFDAGYETVESFSRAFNRMFGCPPSQYREKHLEEMQERLPGTIHYQPESARNGLTIKNSGGHDMEVKIETRQPKDVLFVRHTGPYAECDKAWNTLCAWACPKGLCRIDAEYIGICYDDPQVTPSEKIRYDACVTIADETQGEGAVGRQTIAGGTYAVAIHKGPYTTLEETYAQLMGQWLPQSGKQLRDDCPSLEIYLNDPKETPPEELLTAMYLPLQD